jgi:uncharacterized integral membrane protein (TIGR00698 family)
MSWQKAVFAALVLVSLSPIGSAPLALALGIALAFVAGNPFPDLAGRPTRLLLQVSVVCLGFGMDLGKVYEAGRSGIIFTIATIAGTLLLGALVGGLLKVDRNTSVLVSSGTAICGGSAIAAVGPAIDADSEQMSFALGTVFVLNSAALLLFPVLGHAFALNQAEFGLWSAIAIHDTSSVVGAAATFGEESLAIATTIKLARALWIAPLALAFGWIYGRGTGGRARAAVPWFILLFLLASLIRTIAPATVPPSLFDAAVNLAKAGMIVTLFLIGASLTPKTLRSLGPRALLQGIILWIVISAVSLAVILYLY